MIRLIWNWLFELLILPGKEEMAMSLLKNGVNANTTDYEGRYPMFFAALRGSLCSFQVFYGSFHSRNGRLTRKQNLFDFSQLVDLG